MVGNPYRYRVTLHQLENRHATAGCLLAPLLIIPVAARTYSMTCLMATCLLYVLLVVPIAAGYFSLGTGIRTLRLGGVSLFHQMRHAWLFLLWFHELYCSLHHIHTTVTQILFFLVAEKAICPEQRFISLYSLLFYTMLAYLYHSLQSRQWTQLMFTTTTADFFRLTSAFIIVRLGKGVAMSFILISITLQFDHLEPNIAFISVTSIYFTVTQFLRTQSKNNVGVVWLQQMDLFIFEGLEEFWLPLLLNSFTILMSCGCIILALYNNTANLLLCLIVSYSNVLVETQQLREDCITPLNQQRLLLDRFPRATRDQLADTVCAICLDNMHLFTARVTPCRHVFHGRCLRRCIQHYQQCPLCKQPIIV